MVTAAAHGLVGIAEGKRAAHRVSRNAQSTAALQVHGIDGAATASCHRSAVNARSAATILRAGATTHISGSYQEVVAVTTRVVLLGCAVTAAHMTCIIGMSIILTGCSFWEDAVHATFRE